MENEIKRFVIAGWSKKEERMVFFNLGDDSAYTGFESHRITGATIFEEDLYICFKDIILDEAKCDDVVNLIKIEIKCGRVQGLGGENNNGL